MRAIKNIDIRRNVIMYISICLRINFKLCFVRLIFLFRFVCDDDNTLPKWLHFHLRYTRDTFLSRVSDLNSYRCRSRKTNNNFIHTKLIGHVPVDIVSTCKNREKQINTHIRLKRSSSDRFTLGVTQIDCSLF